MTCTGTESGDLLDGHIVALDRGSQLRVMLSDGREIGAIPLLEALEEVECPGALIFNRPVQVRMYKHPRLPRIVWIGLSDSIGVILYGKELRLVLQSFVSGFR